MSETSESGDALPNRENDHPEDQRPRMDVEVLEANASAEAEAVTRPIGGKNEPKRTGEVSVRTVIKIKCTCDTTITMDSVQKSVICQSCGRRWEQ